MNRTIALSLLALSAAAMAKVHAGEITMDPFPFVPTLTRAQVQEELQQFRAMRSDAAQEAGTMDAFLGERSRADVTAEYLSERDAVAAMTGEDSGSMYLVARRDIRTPATHVVAREE